MQKTDNEPILRFTPWAVIHGTLLCVMTLSICIGLAAYISYLVALPVAVSITALFSHIANTVTVRPFANGILRGFLLTLVLIFLFSITGAFSYATLYETLVAEENGKTFLDNQITSSRVKLHANAAGASALIQQTTQLFEYSKREYSKEKDQGGSCPNYTNSSNTVGTIAKFRRNDELAGEQISKLVQSTTADFLSSAKKIPTAFPKTYLEALEDAKILNEAIQKFNDLRSNTSLKDIENNLNTLKNNKINNDRDCGDIGRNTLIESAIRSVAQIQKDDPMKEIRPGLDIQNKKEITSISLLRGLTLVSAIPPISVISSTIGINTTFSDDPLMKAALKARGTLNLETLPLAISVLLEIMIILTARFAHASGAVAFPLLNNFSYSNILNAQGNSAAFKRFLLNIILRKDSQEDGSGQSKSDKSKRPYSHTSSDPSFAPREKQFALKLLPWVVDLDWGTYLVIPDILSKEIDRHAAAVLVYEELATIVALHVPWVELAAIDYSLLRKAQEGRYGVDHTGCTFHVYKLSVHFTQLLRLEFLQGSMGTAQPL